MDDFILNTEICLAEIHQFLTFLIWWIDTLSLNVKFAQNCVKIRADIYLHGKEL